MAIRHNVSISTVIRVLERFVDIKPKALSEVICIDEFKSTTRAGNYSFMLANPNTGEIIDILKNRNKVDLIKYFNNFDRKQRYKVKYVIMDLWKPYKDMVAIIVADTFHYVRQVYWAFNQFRVKVQNQLLKHDISTYRTVKGNWKLLSAYSENINSEKTYYSRK